MRSFVEDYLLNREQFSLTLSPKKQTSVEISVNPFKAKILNQKEKLKSQTISTGGKLDFSNTKMDIIDEESDITVLPTTPTFSKLMSEGSKFQFSQGSQPATPEFKKNYEI